MLFKSWMREVIATICPLVILTAAEQAKENDLKYALKIAGLGSLPDRDKSGNISTAVWAPTLQCSAVGHLVQAKSIEEFMWQQLRQQIEDNQAMVKQLEDPSILPTWMMQQAKTWEEIYKKQIVRPFDISQSILTAMHEVMFMIRPHLEQIGWSESKIREQLKQWKKDHVDAAHIHLLPPDQLVMRFLFRYENTAVVMSDIAGAVLKKSEVCNKPGAYATRIVRHDLTTPIDERFERFKEDIEYDNDWVVELRKVLETQDQTVIANNIQYIIDHTKYLHTQDMLNP